MKLYELFFRIYLRLLPYLRKLRRLLRIVGVGDRHMVPCLCCSRVVEEECRANRYSPGWLHWEAVHEHVAPCGLICANGMTMATWDTVQKGDVQRHDMACTRCYPQSAI